MLEYSCTPKRRPIGSLDRMVNLIVDFFSFRELFFLKHLLHSYSYRMLLDRWQQYSARAKFDIEGTRYCLHLKSPSVSLVEIHVRCNFCNQPIAANNSSGSAGRRGMSSQLGNTSKSLCPHCRKSLPRCSLCLLPLGTPAESAQSVEGSANWV
jgi:hypothetical protein